MERREEKEVEEEVKEEERRTRRSEGDDTVVLSIPLSHFSHESCYINLCRKTHVISLRLPPSPPLSRVLDIFNPYDICYYVCVGKSSTNSGVHAREKRQKLPTRI